MKELVFRSRGAVNAVALNDDDDERLRAYYLDTVVVGDGAFVLGNNGKHTFTQMLKRKFTREILYSNTVTGTLPGTIALLVTSRTRWSGKEGHTSSSVGVRSGT